MKLKPCLASVDWDLESFEPITKKKKKIVSIGRHENKSNKNSPNPAKFNFNAGGDADWVLPKEPWRERKIIKKKIWKNETNQVSISNQVCLALMFSVHCQD